jgi:hypothetical protein
MRLSNFAICSLFILIIPVSARFNISAIRIGSKVLSDNQVVATLRDMGDRSNGTFGSNTLPCGVNNQTKPVTEDQRSTMILTDGLLIFLWL